MNFEELKYDLQLNNVQILDYFVKENKFNLSLRYKNLNMNIENEAITINTKKLFKRIIKNLDIKLNEKIT